MRNRNLNGDDDDVEDDKCEGISACTVGGEGSWLGVVSMLCNARHVEYRLVIAGWEEPPGGESGGDAKRAFWKRGLDAAGAEESHDSAEGSNIVAMFVMGGLWEWWWWEGRMRDKLRCDCDRRNWMRR